MDVTSARTIQRAAFMGVVGAFVDSFRQSDMWYDLQQGGQEYETEERGSRSICEFMCQWIHGQQIFSWLFTFKDQRLGSLHIIADYERVRLISWTRGIFVLPGMPEPELPHSTFDVAENDEPIEGVLFVELLEATRGELYRYLRRHNMPTRKPVRAILGPQKT